MMIAAPIHVTESGSTPQKNRSRQTPHTRAVYSSGAISEASPSLGGDDPILSIVFDQAAYQDQDSGAEPSIALRGREIVEWDDWFKIFNEKNLALVVSEEVPGRKDSFHEIVAR